MKHLMQRLLVLVLSKRSFHGGQSDAAADRSSQPEPLSQCKSNSHVSALAMRYETAYVVGLHFITYTASFLL